MVSGMSKQNPRTSSVHKLVSFDIRSIPKKPPARSLDRRRCRQAIRVQARSAKGKQ
jgi:hypothetical protein